MTLVWPVPTVGSYLIWMPILLPSTQDTLTIQGKVIFTVLVTQKNGVKTVFMSNSFSAYRIDVLQQLGGFPSDTILCEDMYFTAKAVLAGYKVAYVSEAVVRHSHNYSAVEEFKRYFDIGVFHADEPWIREKFGGAGGEGKNLFSLSCVFF